MKQGDTITVLAESMSRHGDGVGTTEGIEVHVAGLLPGETGEVSLNYVSRQHLRAHGSVVHLRNEHPGRRQAPCVHHGRCNGCAMMDLDLEHQQRIKTQELEHRFGLHLDRMVSLGGDGLHYRYSSKRVIAGKPGDLVLGSYMRSTHKVVDMRGCLVDHPDIVSAANELVAAANEAGVAPFDERSGRGELRYVWFKTDGRGAVLLAIITAEPRATSIFRLADALHIPVGIAWGVNSRHGNDMRGTTLRPIRGRQSLSVAMAGAEVEVGPQAFLQPNPELASAAYEALIRVPAGGRPHGRLAYDLYAGAGITTALLQQRFENVVACEAFPESAHALGIRPQLVEEFLADILGPRPRPHPHRAPDFVVANPPRGGLGPLVCDQLNTLRAPRLHIMSCNPRSLRDDLERLTGSQGAYRRLAVRGFDTLPQTVHTEIVAWLVGRS